MTIRTFIKRAHRRFARHPSASGQFLRDHTYDIYNITTGYIYTIVNKAGRRGFCQGNRFEETATCIASPTEGYGIEDGYLLRDYDGWLKLLDYITKSGDEAHLKWAMEALAPRL